MIEMLNNKLTDINILIFDLDGTIVNTDEANFLAYKEAVKEIKKIDLPSLYFKNERLTRNKLKEILPSLNNQDYKKIIRIKDTVYSKYLQETSINSSMLKIINDFSRTNRIILATNSHKERANLILKYYNLTDAFDGVCQINCVTNFHRAESGTRSSPNMSKKVCKAGFQWWITDHFCEASRTAKYRLLRAELSLGKMRRLRVNLRKLMFRDSMAFVV